MDKQNVQRRLELAEKLLNELKNVYLQSENLSQDIGKNSNFYYEEVFARTKEELSSFMETYRKNVSRAREINNEITSRINAWYAFIKNEKETASVLFPIRYSSEKKRLNQKMKELNDELSALAINNRFVKEKLAQLEHELEIKAVSLAHAGGNYQAYETLLLKQGALTAELRYLLPTIPGLCPADISCHGIDGLMEKLH